MARTAVSDKVAGVLLAGGNGTRMLPLTRDRNKHLLPVHMRPMIDYALGTLLGMGLSDILVVTGRKHMGQVVDVLGSGAEYGAGVEFTYRVQDEARGIADALALARPFAAGRRLSVMLADNVLNDDTPRTALRAFAEAEPPHAVNFLTEVDDAAAYGVARLEDGRIVEILEKPAQPPSRLAVTGLYLYPTDAFDFIAGLTPSARGELEISDLNNHYARAGRLEHYVVRGWFDAGEPEPWARTCRYVQDHPECFGPDRFRLRVGP
ncbi:MAG: sugar phosphate nucleotidyltransferase [Planctomycetota bacterium]|nr:sugar phosphate nucleotidyltransferase [Planctomycetota bacterium]